MKADFLRHEYTWSKQSISGSLGLGITSSSTPREMARLREMEKLAAMAEPDTRTGIDVELLIYSTDAGFVKMAVKPVPPGEDQRKNKKVYLYQCVDPDIMDPAIYCIPRGAWEHEEETELAPVTLSEDWPTAREILDKYELTDRLPDLFRAVFWCVFRGESNLAFFVPWAREDYASRSREIMYAVHSILPGDLRKNAGYSSLGCGMNRRSSFYFTGEAPESDAFDLSLKTYSGRNRQDDRLDDFFYETLSRLFCSRESLYDQFMEDVQILIRDRTVDKNLLREVEWLFLRFCLQNMIDIPEHSEVMGLFPQLFYSAGDSPVLSEIRDDLIACYHMENWDGDAGKYLKILENGMTKKGEDQILKEMDWVLVQMNAGNQEARKDYLEELSQSRKTIYTKLMTRAAAEEGSISSICFKEHQADLPSIKDYIDGMEPDLITEEAKETWMLRAIEILNEDVFETGNYEIVTGIADLILWREPWKEVLKGFLVQLKDRSAELTDSQLDSACRIEEIYEKLTGVREDSGLKEEKRRRKEGEGSEKASDYPEKGEKEVYRTLDEEESREGFLSFLVRGLPYGFLTACILYLLRYALLIGHWKISIGVGGMWMILMLNYATERIERKKADGYRLWQALGLCLIEGYILKTIAWMILPQQFRVYFFLILGVITMLIQSVHGIMLLKKRSREEEEL